MFAAHHRLGNLAVIIDVNGQQALGYTRDVLDLEPLADRWRSFGWDVQEVDGHDWRRWHRRSIGSPGRQLAAHAGRPTVFGKGVSFMERRSVALPADVRRRVRAGA